MEFLPLLRAIWRRRRRVGIGLIVAVAVLIGLGGTKLVTTRSGLAWTRVALDTPKSQLVYSDPAGAETLAWRAALLAHLTTANTFTTTLTRRLGLGSDQLIVVDPSLTEPSIPTDTSAAALKVEGQNVTPYVLTVYANSQVPVISLEAAAPDSQGASRLAAAAVAVLESESSNRAPVNTRIPTGTGAQGVQPFVVSQVQPLRVRLTYSSSLPTKAICGALFVFVIWCVGAQGILAAGSRRAGRRDALPQSHAASGRGG